MRVAFACDHRGFEIKDAVLKLLKERNLEVVDCGCSSDAPADYPDTMIQAAEEVGRGRCERAIGACYTGIGSAIAANKVRGVRAALVHSVEEARLSRAHNDANMLILGAGFLPRELLGPVIETWLTTPFEGGRHERRVNKIKTYEQKNCL